jgi:hypothetical protein
MECDGIHGGKVLGASGLQVPAFYSIGSNKFSLSTAGLESHDLNVRNFVTKSSNRGFCFSL